MNGPAMNHTTEIVATTINAATEPSSLARHTGRTDQARNSFASGIIAGRCPLHSKLAGRSGFVGTDDGSGVRRVPHCFGIALDLLRNLDHDVRKTIQRAEGF